MTALTPQLTRDCDLPGQFSLSNLLLINDVGGLDRMVTKIIALLDDLYSGLRLH